jgi:hypothetical protein
MHTPIEKKKFCYKMSALIKDVVIRMMASEERTGSGYPESTVLSLLTSIEMSVYTKHLLERKL